MKSYFIVVILFSFLLISNGCKEKQPEVAEVSKELFYGKIVYSSIVEAVSYTHLRAHETVLDLVCRLLLEKKKKDK